MRVISLNVSKPRTVIHDGGKVRTGIFKQPVVGPRAVRRLGIEGDGQADHRYHGGPDQAVYAYPVEHYAVWQQELGRAAMPFGQFGENLTTEGLDETGVMVGDRLRIGGALCEVTHPRLPCSKLAMRMEAGKDFVKRFQQSGRLGFYLRVLEEGEIAAGDHIDLIATSDASVSIAEFLETYAAKRPKRDALLRVLAAPGLSQGWRARFEKKLGGAPGSDT
ncbi:MAG TPA: MOSC domain-containing protein [Methylomirabilota bacterium]|jgi:MOSC domain-containing protein YiiM|nr:MOSC domain-containing protein [Methylomirabilota bacterium]